MADENSAAARHLRSKVVSAQHSLKHGTFRISETGRSINFVLVPEDFTPESGTVVSAVLRALELSDPDIAFYFHKGGAVGNGSTVVMERVRRVLDGISDACAQTKSLSMLRQPFTGNVLAEMVCDSAANVGKIDCPVLGLFHLGTLTAIDTTLPADVRTHSLKRPEWQGRTFYEQLEAHHKWEEKYDAVGDGQPVDPHEQLPREYTVEKCRDVQRVLIGASIMDGEGTAASAKEVSKTIDVSCAMTPTEKDLAKAMGRESNGLAMLDRVTHVVVFADSFPGRPINADGSAGAYSDVGGNWQGKYYPDYTQSSPNQLRFATMLNNDYPTGVIAAGGSKPLFKAGIECLKSGRPLFCFRGSGGSAETLATLIEFGYLKKGSRDKLPATASELQHFIATRFGPDCGLAWRDEAQALARNFPEHFNPIAALVIDVGEVGGRDDVSLTNYSPEAGDSIDMLQDQITRVMASVYDNVPELGGRETDRRSLRHAQAVLAHLKRGAARYRREASLLSVLIRLFFLGTAVSAALRESELNGAAGDSNVGQWVAMALPLLLGVASTLFATYRPMQTFAALKSAAVEIESEAYRFRTRTRPYYASKSTASGKGHRQLFAAACSRILATHLAGDVRVGAARIADTEQWLRDEDPPGVNASADTHAGVCGVSNPKQRGGLNSKVAPATPVCRRTRVASPAPIDRAAAATGAEQTTAAVTMSPAVEAAAPTQPKPTQMLGADDYMQHRALMVLHSAQRDAPRIARQLKLLQLFVIAGSALMVAFQSKLPLWTPIVLASISSAEFIISYQQLESQLPAVNATALVVMRVLIWWDGLSLIQQRMPGSKDRLVDIVERALVMQHQGFVQGAIANLGMDLQDERSGDQVGGIAAGGKKADLKSTDDRYNA